MEDEDALARPIGWWLRAAHTRLDAALEDALAGTGVDRREWQVLESLARGPSTAREVLDALAVFDPPEALAEVVDTLTARGEVTRTDGRLALTGEGERRHAALGPLVGRVRGRVRAALPEEDYRTLVRLLARVTGALEPVP